MYLSTVYLRGAHTVSQMCRHQGGTENFFIDAMKPKGLEVERSTVPTAIDLVEAVTKRQDPSAYTATVGVL